MQSESLCSNDIEGLNTESLIPVEFLYCGATQQSHPQDLSLVELGKQLLLAAKNGQTEAIRDLMRRGAPFSSDCLGTTALHLAAQNNQLDTATVLLESGVSRDARTKVDRTPLHMAAYEGHHEMAILLLSYGVDVDSRDMLKMTPLHWAVEREHTEVIDVLLEHGADPNAMSKFDKTPVSLALEHNRLDFVDMLQQKREILNVQVQHQNPIVSAEIKEATQSLMQMESERHPEHHQFELQQQQQLHHQLQQQKRKMAQVQIPKKQKVVPQSFQVPVMSDEEREKEEEIAERINSIEHSTFNKHKDMGAFTSLEQPLRLLQAHGITMIPVDDDASIVENAMESGRTVVLTEAGKLALNLTRAQSIGVKGLQVGSRKGTPRKVIAIRADQILSSNPPGLTARGPNILKRSNVGEGKLGKIIFTPISNNTTLTTKKSSITPVKKKFVAQSRNQNPVILHLDDDIEEITEDENSSIDYFDPPAKDNASLCQQLIEARRALIQCRKELRMKDEEIDIYKQTIEKLSQHRHTESI